MKSRPALAARSVPARPAGRRARRQAEIRSRILRAALDLLARQGLSATTIEQITEAADVGKGTFFNYFLSKEHVLAGFGEMQVAKVKAAWAEARKGDQPVHAVLHRLAHAVAEEPGRSPSLVRGLLIANLSSDSLRELTRQNMERGRRVLARLVVQGQQRGEIRSDLKPADLARLYQQAFFGALLVWGLFPSSKLGRWLDTTFELFWSGVAARSG